MHDLTRDERIYLAAFMDGEGCISVYSDTCRRYSISIRIGSTDGRFLALWQSKTGLGSVRQVAKKGDPSSHLAVHTMDFYSWSIGAIGEVESFLEGVYEHLMLKRDQAEVALEFTRTAHRQGKFVTDDILRVREWCYTELRRLKREPWTMDKSEQRGAGAEVPSMPHRVLSYVQSQLL